MTTSKPRAAQTLAAWAWAAVGLAWPCPLLAEAIAAAVTRQVAMMDGAAAAYPARRRVRPRMCRSGSTMKIDSAR